PELYGAFPTDAYSHTPAGAGVKQPGLTGQVKEDVISRFGELGVQVVNGEVRFNPSLINPNEFLKQKEIFKYIDLEGNKQQIELNNKQLAFTFCQVPVIYTLSSENKITVYWNDGRKNEIQGNILNAELSNKIFNRTGEIRQITFNLNKI
ncbi:MAG: hypothetical protein R3182_07855, partial [Draconibacterium sp.]|nr:hypothetical protein [Draconibacterium sp.]